MGLLSLNAAPQNDEERHQSFLLKRRTVEALVKRISIMQDRELDVEIRLNLIEILRQASKISEIRQVGTYTHK